MTTTTRPSPTSAPIVPARLDDLVVARLATTKSPPSDVQLARQLRPFAPATLDDAQWATAVAAAVARLVAAGTLAADHAVVGGPAVAGQRLGAAGAFAWKRATERLIPALALDIAADDARDHARLTSRDDWAAATVSRALGLWTAGPPPRLAAVCDGLVWRALGLGGKPKRTPPEVRAHFVRGVLESGDGPPARLVHLLAAREAGAPRADLRALREALVRRWLCGQSWRSEATAEDFARAVREVAEHATDGAFGGRKVFISAVWRSLRERPGFADLTLAAFKERLLATHKAGLVVLARADLTAAMDAGAVRDSETAHLEARYHFVERGGAS